MSFFSKLSNKAVLENAKVKLNLCWKYKKIVDNALLIIIWPLENLPISVSWWSFNRVWMAASQLESPGPSSIFRWSYQFCSLDSLHSSSYSFSRTYAGLYIYHLFIWTNLNFLHNSQCFTLPTKACLVLYCLLHSLM